MLHTQYAGALRRAMTRVLGADALQPALAVRPSANPFGGADPESLGEVTGYRYRARNPLAALSMGLPGELACDLDSEWFMDLTDGFPVQIAENDVLAFANGDTRRVSMIRGSGQFSGRDIYRLYKLEAV